MITTLLLLFFVLAAVSFVWWGISRLTLPEPIKTVVLVVVGLVGLIVIWNLIAGGALNLSLR